MDSLTILTYLPGLVLLIFTVITSLSAIRGFRQSKHALEEAASYVTVIVAGLSKRFEPLEANTIQLRKGFQDISQGYGSFQDVQTNLQLKSEALSKSIQDLAASDKQIQQDITYLKSLLNKSDLEKVAKPSQVVSQSRDFDGSGLERLTETERQLLLSLLAGSLSGPQISKMLNKSREHTARLLKKMYMEGYVDRDALRSPFRYKLNDKLRSSIDRPTTPSEPEMT